jgi:hypothetical protein
MHTYTYIFVHLHSEAHTCMFAGPSSMPSWAQIQNLWKKKQFSVVFRNQKQINSRAPSRVLRSTWTQCFSLQAGNGCKLTFLSNHKILVSARSRSRTLSRIIYQDTLSHVHHNSLRGGGVSAARLDRFYGSPGSVACDVAWYWCSCTSCRQTSQLWSEPMYSLKTKKVMVTKDQKVVSVLIALSHAIRMSLSH